MSRTEDLQNALTNLQGSSADVEACAVVSEDGLIIASSLPQGYDENHIAAMSAAMLSMGTRTTVELKRGAIQQLFVKGDNGYAILMYAGAHAALLAMTRKEAKLGLIFLDMNRAAEEVKNVLA